MTVLLVLPRHDAREHDAGHVALGVDDLLQRLDRRFLARVAPSGPRTPPSRRSATAPARRPSPARARCRAGCGRNAAPAPRASGACAASRADAPGAGSSCRRSARPRRTPRRGTGCRPAPPRVSPSRPARPSPIGQRKIWCRRGLRQSQSITRMRRPLLAIRRASEATITDLPSDGVAELNRMVLGDAADFRQLDADLDASQRFAVGRGRLAQHLHGRRRAAGNLRHHGEHRQTGHRLDLVGAAEGMRRRSRAAGRSRSRAASRRRRPGRRSAPWADRLGASGGAAGETSLALACRMSSAPVLCLARFSIASSRLRLTVASRSSASSPIESSFTTPICCFRVVEVLLERLVARIGGARVALQAVDGLGDLGADPRGCCAGLGLRALQQRDACCRTWTTASAALRSASACCSLSAEISGERSTSGTLSLLPTTPLLAILRLLQPRFGLDLGGLGGDELGIELGELLGGHVAVGARALVQAVGCGDSPRPPGRTCFTCSRSSATRPIRNLSTRSIVATLSLRWIVEIGARPGCWPSPTAVSGSSASALTLSTWRAAEQRDVDHATGRCRSSGCRAGSASCR